MFRLLFLFAFSTFFLPMVIRGQDKPNIIIFLTDDLGYGDLGCFGQKIIPTPYLDQLAKEGCKFTSFYSGSTVCAPSRYALMTGKHMGHALIRGNKETPIPRSEITIPKIAKSVGYTTGMFGKWGLGQADNEGAPEDQGWDHFLGYLTHRSAHNFYVSQLWETKNGKTNAFPTDSTANASPLIFQTALEFIRSHRDQPFLLYIASTLPHAEMVAPTPESIQPFLREDGRSIFVETPFVKGTGMSPTYSSQDKPNASTAAMIHQVDLDMGRLRNLLTELGIDKNTYIFFTSDNGPHQEAGRNVKEFESTAGLRGYKRDLYEGGIRVPTIVYGPGVRNQINSEPLANWDILPTIAEITGLDVTHEIDGISFLDLLKKGKIERSHRYLYWEFHERGFDQALRYGKWKAIKRSSNGSKMELYDLEKDWSENLDIADLYPKVVQVMEKFFNEARVDSPDYPIRK